MGTPESTGLTFLFSTLLPRGNYTSLGLIIFDRGGQQ